MTMLRARGQVVVCAAGLKGALFLEGLIGQGVVPVMVASYPQQDDAAKGFARIEAAALEAGSEFVETRRPDLSKRSEEDLIFIVGWQYLLLGPLESAVVFHDSLLPRYRGFAPTVSALINGDTEIGVTALRPVAEVDSGPIIAQAAMPIAYPISIAEALRRQAALMLDLAGQIHNMWRQGPVVAKPQISSEATFSLWRDDQDYLIDWSAPAERIARFVDAVGYPYAGAQTYAGRDRLVVKKVSELPDLPFDQRHCGKIWKIESGRPQVVCGSGLLSIEDCRDSEGRPYKFEKLRTRLGSAPSD